MRGWTAGGKERLGHFHFSVSAVNRKSTRLALDVTVNNVSGLHL